MFVKYSERHLKRGWRFHNATDPSSFYTTTSESLWSGSPEFFWVQSTTYDPCNPLLSVPAELYRIDPAWLSCTEGISGFWDPP